MSPSGDFHPNENHSLLGNPLILPQNQILISFWSQKTENQKVEIEENMMSESEKRNNTISQMRLRSVFKMRMSILNTSTTEQMGYGIISFFVYTKSTN